MLDTRREKLGLKLLCVEKSFPLVYLVADDGAAAREPLVVPGVTIRKVQQQHHHHHRQTPPSAVVFVLSPPPLLAFLLPFSPVCCLSFRLTFDAVAFF